jgi:hypothetical protein
MKCQLTPSQIEAWLDGQEDQSLHVADCSQCQQRLVGMQKLRSRMQPPPSPLGVDFARRTAAQVLRTQRVQDTVQQHRKEQQQHPISRLLDNPVAHILHRERSRRSFRLPALAAVLLAYLLPALGVSAASQEGQMVYFAVLQVGLTLLVPLFLLGLEIASLSSLVRGRCLEEMLQTGLKPQVISDSLTLNGLRALIPALLLTTLALLPSGHPHLVSWLPCAAVCFVGGCTLAQAQLLIAGWPRWFSAVGLASALATLAAPYPWQGLGLLTLTLQALWARRQTIAGLLDQQAGRGPSFTYLRPSRAQLWLANFLPDLALLQRELRRGPVLSVSLCLGWTALVAAGFYFKLEPTLWPAVVLTASAWTALRLLHKERESGAYEVLVHSGLTVQDWQASASWLSLLRLAPVLVLVPLLWAWPVSALAGSLQIPVALALGLAATLLLLVSLSSGSVLGIQAARAAVSAREVTKELAREGLWVTLYSLVGLGLMAAFLGELSGVPVAGLWQALPLLPVALAGAFRSRQMGREIRPQASQLALLGLSLCWIAWGCIVRQPSAVVLACLGLWWWAPAAPALGRLATSRQKLLWTGVVFSFGVALPLGVWMLDLLWLLLSDQRVYRLMLNVSTFPLRVAALAPWLLTAAAVITVSLHSRRGPAQDAPLSASWRRRTRGLAALALLVLLTLAFQMNRLLQPLSSSWESQRDQVVQQYGARGVMIPWRSSRGSVLPHWFSGNDRALHGSLTDPLHWSGDGSVVEVFALEPERLLQVESALKQGERDTGERVRLCRAMLLQVARDQYRGQAQAALERLHRVADAMPPVHQARWGDHYYALMAEVRSRVLLGLHSRMWNQSQVQQVRAMLDLLQDSSEDLRALRLQRAVAGYVGANRWITMEGDFSWLERILQQRWAEKNLQRSLLSANLGQEVLDQHYALLKQATSLAFELEELRFAQGRYPSTWSPAPAGARVAYRCLQEGRDYSLQIWLRQGRAFLTLNPKGYRIGTF